MEFWGRKRKIWRRSAPLPQGENTSDSRLLSSLLSLSSLSISTREPSLSPCRINYQHSSDQEKKENYANSKVKAVSGIPCRLRMVAAVCGCHSTKRKGSVSQMTNNLRGSRTFPSGYSCAVGSISTRWRKFVDRNRFARASWRNV
jgi:hypothetical protein